MAKNIVLIACCSSKMNEAAPARHLYTSDLFRKSLKWALRNGDSIYVLSAKYGLVGLDDVIEPYDETLNDKSKSMRADWSEHVWSDLKRCLTTGDTIVLLAGKKYRETLVPMISAAGLSVHVPMQGLGIGQQKQWLSTL